jgi:DtxR family transcriptional regulator, Mn-dependent transcriptional regulator
MTGAAQYLLALCVADRGNSAPIAPGEIAETVDRSAAATTEMLQRLEDRGLVTYEPYKGAMLTTDGRETAEELYETYLILLQFFRDVLELDDYEDEARKLAENISPVVAKRLAATLPLNGDIAFANDS